MGWHGGATVPADGQRRIPLGTWIEVPESDRVVSVSTRGSTLGVSATATLPEIRAAGSAPRSAGGSGAPARRMRVLRMHRRGETWAEGTHVATARDGEATMQVEYSVSIGPSIPIDAPAAASTREATVSVDG